MKRKTLLIGLTTLAVTTSVCGLVACGGDKKDAAPPENDYMITYRSDWQGENDADMKIDGSLDEARWQNKNWYTTCAPYGAVNESVWLKTTAFTTKYGLYIAAVLYDDNIVGDGEFNVTQGTCLEYHYTFRKQDGKLYNASYTDRGRFYLDVFGNYCTKGERMKRGVRVDGVVNSGETVSATFEVFVPWEQAGVEVSEDWYPEEAYVLPGCRVIAEGQTYSLCTLGMVSERWRRDYQAMYYEFDENGYTKADAADAVLGDAKNGFAKSAGWNLDKLSDGEVSLDKTYEYDYIFFRNGFANNFEASMTIYPGDYLYDTDNGIVYDTNGLAMYRDGRSGFYLLTTTGQEFIPYLEYNTLVDTAEDGVQAPARYHLRSLDNFVSAWHVSDDVCDIPNTEKEGAVEFKMIKYGADLFYFADGIYLGTQRVSSLNDSVYVGLYNCNRAATYKGYDFKAYTDDEAKARLNECNIYSVNVTAQAGGKIECAQTWVKAGESVTFKAICESGYLVDTIKLGSADITANCKENVKRYGKYSVTVTDTADISVTFKELSAEQSSTITGMVYSGTDTKATAATLKFASLSDASVVYSVRATSAKGYSVTLPDGKYSVFVTFGTKDAATQEVTVNSDGTHDIRSTPLNVEVGNIKITDEGYYATEYSVTNNRCYIGTAESGAPFVMETTVKDMSDKTWPSVGFIVSAGGNNWIKFVLRLACPGNVTDYYDTLIWHDVYDNPDSPYYVRVVNFDDNSLKTNPFTGVDGTAKLRLIYTGNVYYFYVNDTLIYSIGQDEAIQAGDTHSIANTLGAGKINLGLFAERQITFTNWSVSDSYDDIWNVLGKTVTAEGFDLAVDGKRVADGKVLLGDEVTVSLAGQTNGTFMVDGKMIATQATDGKSVAKFTVTGNHTVTYSVSYAVTGTVTDGNAETIVTIANEKGIVVYTGNTDAKGNYTASLADGIYYVSAQSAKKITNVATVTVNGRETTVETINFTLPVLRAETGNFALDYKTGNYKTEHGDTNNRAYFTEIASGSPFVLETTMKNIGVTENPSAGVILNKGGNHWVRFVIRSLGGGNYDVVIWRDLWDTSDYFGKVIALSSNPFTGADGTAKMQLVHNCGRYFVYVNDNLVAEVSENDSFDNGNTIAGALGDGETLSLGVFAERDVTFTDWSYGVGREFVKDYLGKTLTVAEGMEIRVNGEAATVTDGQVKVLLGDKITASVSPSSFSILLDGTGYEVRQENGKAVAEFTVTKDHSVSYSVAYAVSGTVTNGDAETTVTIVGENGAVAYTGKVDGNGSYSVNLPNGTYYVSAKSATQMTNVVAVTVNGGAAMVNAVKFEKPLVTEWIPNFEQYHIDYKTGAYKTAEEKQYHGGFFAKEAAEAYVLSATVKDMTDTANWSCVGFMVGTQENWLRFTVQYDKDNGAYRFVLWRSYDTPIVGNNVVTLFASESVNIKLEYAGGAYSFYVNEGLVYTTSTESVGARTRVGLYNEYRVTFADWNYAELPVYSVSGTVTDRNADLVTLYDDRGVIYTCHAGTDGGFSISLPNGTYHILTQDGVKDLKVDGTGYAVGEIAYARPIINEWITDSRYTLDATGSYVFENTALNGGWFVGVANRSAYVLEATVTGMPTSTDRYPMAGFMVGTGDDALRFTVQYNKDNSTYRYVVWNQVQGVVSAGGSMASNPFESGSMNIKLVHDAEGYKFYVNGELAYSTEKSFGEDTRVGLINEAQITFKDWKYSAE